MAMRKLLVLQLHLHWYTLYRRFVVQFTVSFTLEFSVKVRVRVRLYLVRTAFVLDGCTQVGLKF